MSTVTKPPQEKVDELRKLEDLLKPYLEEPKSQWPLDTMAKIHKVAGEITTIVGKELYEAMEFPDKRSCNPEGFYSGTNNTSEGFKRPKDGWLGTQDFKIYKTTYTYTDTWDRVPLTAAFYIPDTLAAGDTAPIVWYFHGGGYCTGENDFIPWLSVASLAHARHKKAIIIAPDYPLGPEGNYQDIVQSLKDFLSFYKQNVCFDKPFNKWIEWLLHKIGTEDVKLDLNHVLVEGESAGGLAAATALFLNADKATGAQLNISVALLRYPMIAHYARVFKTEDKINFMGVDYKQDDLHDRANKILKIRDELEELGFLPTRVRSPPPQCMPAAFLLSVLQLWQESFQRQHKGQPPGDRFDTMDGLERAEQSVDKVDAKFLPPIFMFHGEVDTNCLPERTQKFGEILRAKYPHRYTEETAQVEVVKGKSHAFDYDLEEKDADFLKKAHAFVDRYW